MQTLLLLGVLLLGVSDALFREKRSVVYQDVENTQKNEADVVSFQPVTRKPLPIQVVYPGDLSHFVTTDGVQESSADSQRSKRGIRLKDNTKPPWTLRRSSDELSNNVPSEMSFDGAGFLRPESIEMAPSRNPPESESFYPFKYRETSPVHFDDDDLPDLSLEDQVEKHAENKFDGSTPVHFVQHKDFPVEMKPVFPVLPMKNLSLLGSSSGFFNYPFSLTKQVPTVFQKQTDSAHESLLKNHRMKSTPEHQRSNATAPRSKSSIVNFAESSLHLKVQPPRITLSKLRKKRSILQLKDIAADLDSEFDSKSEPLEARNNYQYSRSDDQQDSSSGFIPISGNYNGAIHLTFPFYGGQGHVSPTYSSGPPVQTYHGYNTPKRPEGRHYLSSGPTENYYHPSEARRYSYGILGSGNFEVIRGGILPNDRHHGIPNGGGFHDGRTVYGGDAFNNYGTTEIIIDGPIQGFQGFDSFPTHLINALSKHSELSVHGPERRHDENQLPPLLYPLP